MAFRREEHPFIMTMKEDPQIKIKRHFLKFLWESILGVAGTVIYWRFFRSQVLATEYGDITNYAIGVILAFLLCDALGNLINAYVYFKIKKKEDAKAKEKAEKARAEALVDKQTEKTVEEPGRSE